MKPLHIHKKFIDACKEKNIPLTQYPFNTDRLGIRSLYRYLRKLNLKYFSKASSRHGYDAEQKSRSSGIGEQNHPVTRTPFQRVQFDAHRIDGVFAITMEVKRLMESLTKIVINRLPGMIVYGRPRIGKSKSIEFALNYLPMQLGTLFPILRTKCSSYRVPTEEKFFGDMLSDLKFPFPAKRNPSAMRQQIVNLMLEQGERSRMRRIMLVIDEAQRLTEFHYN